ncbi:hypothetical protein [Mumia zhuanghuii]
MATSECRPLPRLGCSLALNSRWRERAMSLATAQRTATCRPEKTPSAAFDGWHHYRGRATVGAAVERAVLDGGPLDSIRRRAIGASIAAYRDTTSGVFVVPHAAAEALHELGHRHAMIGGDLEGLRELFASAQRAALETLATARRLAPKRHHALSDTERVCAFVRVFFDRACEGFTHTSHILTLRPQDRRERLRAALFRPGTRTNALLEICGLDASRPHLAVVATGEELPRRLLTHAQTVAGLDPHECLVPAGWTITSLRPLPGGQVVLGPVTSLAESGDSVDLARRGAATLRRGVATDRRAVVPFGELDADTLLLAGNAALPDLLIERHLGALQALRPARRLQLGIFLLEWLESGKPLTRVGATLGIPPQTASAHMSALRELLGDKLASSTCRQELRIALHSAVRRWEEELP